MPGFVSAQANMHTHREVLLMQGAAGVSCTIDLRVVQVCMWAYVPFVRSSMHERARAACALITRKFAKVNFLFCKLSGY